MSGSDILREVDEALRVEKAKKFWEENGKAIIIFAVALILGTAAQSGWASYKHHQEEISTAKFVDAMKSKDPLSALQTLSAEKNGSGSALAGLSAAGLAVSNKKWDEAISLYQQVVDNKSAPQTYRDLAMVQMTALKIDHDTQAKADDLQKIISPVKTNKKSAWNSRAVFLSALISAEKQNDFKSARADLKNLLDDPNIPPSFASQVKALDSIYQIKEEAKK
jgi:hypothetical protein